MPVQDARGPAGPGEPGSPAQAQSRRPHPPPVHGSRTSAATIGELGALASEQPLREKLHAQRMLALYRAGRQAEALGAHRDAQLRETREVRALCACRAALSDLAWSPEGRWEAANMGGRNLIGA